MRLPRAPRGNGGRTARTFLRTKGCFSAYERPDPRAAAPPSPAGSPASGRRVCPPGPKRSGGRRPQRRGARGRRGRGKQHTEAAIPVTGRRAPDTGLQVGALNIQSMKPKLLELTEEIDRNDFDVILLSETWLRPTTPNRLLVIPGYSISRADRPDGSGYGGVAILTKSTITSVALKLSVSSHPGSLLESRWALLKLERNRQLIVGSLYRPPRHTDAALRADSADLESQLQRVLIDYPKVPFTIFGDINCDLLKGQCFRACAYLSDFLADYSLEQLVKVKLHYAYEVRNLVLCIRYCAVAESKKCSTDREYMP